MPKTIQKNIQYRADVLAFAEPSPELALQLEESFLDVPRIARTLRFHHRLILGSGLACLLLATVLAFLMRNRYTATATFIPPGGGVSGASALAGQLAQLSGLGAGLLGGAGRTNADLYIGLLKSQVVIDRLIQRFNMQAVYKRKTLVETELQFAGHTEIGYGKDGIFAVTFTDHDPARARDIANAYLQQLQQLTGSLALSESSQRRLFYEERLGQEKNALADAEVALKQSQEKTGLFAPAGQTGTEIQAVARLRDEIATRRVRLASLLHDETEQNPDVLRLRSELANLEGQVAQMQNGKTRDSSGAIPATQVPAIQLDFVRLSREVKYHETLFEIISRQYEAARLDEAHDTPLQLLDRARIPEGPSGPPRLFYMTMASLFGLFTSSLFVVFRERFLTPNPRAEPPAA